MTQKTPLDSPGIRRNFSVNAVWSFIAEAAPFFIALPAVPLLIFLIGKERFGILSIIWVAIGYFNLFDLGLGRAVTQFAAERIGAGRPQDVPGVLWSGLWIILPLGLFVAVIIAVGSPTFSNYLETPGIRQSEIVGSLRWLALAIPFTMVTTMLKGLLQAAHDFRTISTIQVSLGIFVFLGPVLVASLGHFELNYLTLTLLAGRITVNAWFVVAVYRLFPGIRHPSFSKHRMGSMLHYSGWIAISNFIGPLMGYCDRLVIGTYLGAAAVAYYVTPFDIITRTSIFSVSIAAVVFPTVAHLRSTAPRQVGAMMRKVQILIATVTLPFYFVVAAFGSDLLEIWINHEFAAAGALPAALFSAGMLANSVARIPHAVLQGSGRADLTAIAHLIELPIYFLAFFLLLPHFGLAGAAACWAARALLDYAILQCFAGSLLNLNTMRNMSGPLFAVLAFVVLAISGSFPLIIKVVMSCLLFAVSVAVACYQGYTPRKLIGAFLNGAPGRF